MSARTLTVPPDTDALVEAVIHGGGPGRIRAAGRLMTRLEAEPHRLAEVYRRLPWEQWPRPRLVLGITGAPGTGKSTLVDAVVFELRRRAPDRRVGVVAVDPTSPFTGGAILGDRVRMMRHATDPLVFIRSVATRGHLGGLSLGVRGVLRVMGLIGCDVVIVETVGVGQSEVEVTRVADLVCVVLAPGAGDSVQMLKAGLMEVADLFVVNKADTAGADAVHRSLLGALSLGSAGNGRGGEHGDHGDEWDTADGRPDVLLTAATDGTGVVELVDRVLGAASVGGARDGRRGARRDALAEARSDVRDAVLEAGRRRLDRVLAAGTDRLDAVLAGEVSVEELVEELFAEPMEP